MYKAAVDLLTTTQPLLSGEEVREIADKTSKHIHAESMMIEEAKKLLDQVTGPRVTILLSAIHSDEITHHGVLVSIEKNIAKKEVYTEEEFWSQVWRDSPWHGTPGG